MTSFFAKRFFFFNDFILRLRVCWKPEISMDFRIRHLELINATQKMINSKTGRLKKLRLGKSQLFSK